MRYNAQILEAAEFLVSVGDRLLLAADLSDSVREAALESVARAFGVVRETESPAFQIALPLRLWRKDGIRIQ